MIDSEKLNVNFECGSVRPVRGVIRTEKANTKKYPRVNESFGAVRTAKHVTIAPRLIITSFEYSAIFFLSIKKPVGVAGEGLVCEADTTRPL